MPATFVASPVASASTRRFSASLSRSGDAAVSYRPSGCMECGAAVPAWGYRNVGGVGVLTHETVTDCEPCPAAAALAFVWETGAAL